MTQTRRAFLSTLAPAMAGAQTLAHPGWRGNGITAERWWQHATAVQLPLDMTFAQATVLLNTVSSAGADTLILPDLQIQPGGAAPFADRFGTSDELDALLRETSSRRMHMLLTAPLLQLANSSGELHFWLARGIAGFSVGTLRPADVDTLHVLRSTIDRYPAQRLLLTALDPTADAGFVQRFVREFPPPTFRLLSAADAAASAVSAPAAIAITDPATAPVFRGQLPVLLLAALTTQGGATATRFWLERNRIRPTHGSSRRH